MTITLKLFCICFLLLFNKIHIYNTSNVVDSTHIKQGCPRPHLFHYREKFTTLRQSEFVPVNGRSFVIFKIIVSKCTMSIANNVSNFIVIANHSNSSGLLNVVERYTDEQLRSLPLFEGYPKPLLQFTAVCCMLFMIIGIPGNLVTIFALAKCKKVSFFLFPEVHLRCMHKTFKIMHLISNIIRLQFNLN